MDSVFRRTPRPLLRLGLALLWAPVLADGAAAATFQVTNLADSGPNSLRQAVLNANAAPGADQVTFAPGLTGTITLTSGEILITDPLVVSGPGAGVLTVSGNDQSRIFHVENSPVAAPIDVTLSGLTLTHGYSSSFQVGGAVFADSENLTILNSVVSNSSAGLAQDPPVAGCGGNVGFLGTDGGTLRIADSTLTGGFTIGIGSSFGGNLCVSRGGFILERSALLGGSAYSGGGLYVDLLTEDSTIVSSTLSGNEGSDSGGGIFADSLGATLTIDSSTISGNTGGGPSPAYTGFGGGMYIGQGQGNVQVINSTISGNHTNGGGGGITFLGSSLLLRLTTVSNNTAGREGGGLAVGNPSAVVQLDHAIVANGAPQDLSAILPMTSVTITANYSLIEAPGNALLAGANNLVGADPLLGPLASNGGPTLTHRPLPGSPAIDAGNPAIPSPPATDQRGFARIFGAAIDMGSVEARPELIEVPTLSQAGLLALAALLFGAGVRRLRQTAS